MARSFVSNNRTGSLIIKDSLLSGNPSQGFETAGYKGIFFLGSGTAGDKLHDSVANE